MYSGLIVALVFIACVIFFLIYKRHMVAKLFSLDIATQVSDFEEDIQETARIAVDKITIATEDLAILLEQAEETIEELKIRVKIAEDQLYKYSLNDMKNNFNITEFTPKTNKKVEKQTFSEHLIDATSKTALHLNVDDEKDDDINLAKKELLSNNKKEKVIIFPNGVDDEVDTLERQKQITKLFKEGYDNISIARKLNVSLTEVELTRKFGNN